MYWIIGVDNKVYGPVSLDFLKKWIDEGRVNEKTLVRIEGEPHWRQLFTFPELASLLPPPPLLLPPFTQPKETNGLAIASLICGILSIIFCFCCCWGIPFNILSIVFGIIALSQIKRQPSQTGRGMAIAGIVLGILSLLLGIIMTLFYFSLGGHKEIMRDFKQWRI